VPACEILAGSKAYRGKRALDVLLSCIAVVLFSPLITVLLCCIYIEDRERPWFVQSRVGLGRSSLVIVKLRTMRANKVTRVGRWLRSTGLDELTQFINVLRGEMSIVGPRPLTREDIDRLRWNGAEHDWRFTVKPGITGLSQLFGGVIARGSRRLDRTYLRGESLQLDLKLIAWSFAANVVGKRVVRRWLRRSKRAPPSDR